MGKREVRRNMNRSRVLKFLNLNVFFIGSSLKQDQKVHLTQGVPEKPSDIDYHMIQQYVDFSGEFL